MDVAVALVDIYLRINGYFTVTEYPVIEAKQFGGFRSATDLDVIAFRFPGAGMLTRSLHPENFAVTCQIDSVLGAPADGTDMLVCEVKEGRAHLNEAMRDPAVLRAALLRFGCCSADHIDSVVEALLRRGESSTHCGHKMRMIVFGATDDSNERHKYRYIALGHVVDFLEQFVRSNWELVRQAQFKDPTFNLLVMLEKARRGLPAAALIPR